MGAATHIIPKSDANPGPMPAGGGQYDLSCMDDQRRQRGQPRLYFVLGGRPISASRLKPLRRESNSANRAIRWLARFRGNDYAQSAFGAVSDVASGTTSSERRLVSLDPLGSACLAGVDPRALDIERKAQSTPALHRISLRACDCLFPVGPMLPICAFWISFVLPFPSLTARACWRGPGPLHVQAASISSIRSCFTGLDGYSQKLSRIF